jgi:signal transduction histidine kinase
MAFRHADGNGRQGDSLISTSQFPGTGWQPQAGGMGAEVSRLMDRLLASERMALIGQSTAQIAHHLTNQLSILPLIQLMEREYAADPQLAEFLSVLRESYHNIAETVQQLRRMVRFEAIDAAPGPVLLGDSVRELAAFLRHRKGFPWSHLRLDLREDCLVMSSRTKLHHVLVNLLYNAADVIAKRDDGRIYVRLQKDGDTGVVEVEDNGPGIQPALIPRIWDPSYSTKAGAIHGLGLHLVKRLVESDGGQVSCRSLEGVQTVFSVRLRLATFEETASEISHSAEVSPPHLSALERIEAVRT